MKKYAKYDRVRIDSTVEQTVKLLAVLSPVAVLFSATIVYLLYRLARLYISVTFALYLALWMVLVYALTKWLFGEVLELAHALGELDGETARPPMFQKVSKTTSVRIPSQTFDKTYTAR